MFTFTCKIGDIECPGTITIDRKCDPNDEETNNPEEREVYWIEKKQSFKNGYNATKTK